MSEIIVSRIVKGKVDIYFKVPFWERLHMCFSIMFNKGIRIKQGENFVLQENKK
ncbi:MAG: hypothetical protein ACP6IY_09515 [Promethearchaeia archaeon]